MGAVHNTSDQTKATERRRWGRLGDVIITNVEDILSRIQSQVIASPATLTFGITREGYGETSSARGRKQASLFARLTFPAISRCSQPTASWYCMNDSGIDGPQSIPAI